MKTVKKKIAEGAELHTRAIFGGKTAVSRAYEFFEEAHLSNPQDPLITAYYGDCMSMTGRASGDSTAMFANAIKGMKLLDEAVNKAPDSIEIRLLRADQSFRIPESFFKRTATTITDLEYLINRYRDDNSLFSKDLYYNILFLLGKAYERMDMFQEAKEVWTKLVSESKNPKYKSMVEKELLKIQPVTSTINESAPPDKETLLAEGIRLHDLAVAGNRMASKTAFEIMQKAYNIDENDPLVEGYYASSMALISRDSSDTTIMFTHSIKALKHIKRAVSRDFNNISLRLLRAYMTYCLPEFFFQMSSKAVKDFKFLKTAYEQDDSIFPKELYWQILYDLGICYYNSDDCKNAEKVWNNLLEISSDLKYSSLIQQFGRSDI